MSRWLRVGAVIVIVAAAIALSYHYLTAKSATTTTSTSTSTSTTSTTSSTTTTTTATVASCGAASDFTGALVNGQGAAGTVYDTVTLTNNGPTCTMDGWPTVRLADGTTAITATVTESSAEAGTGAPSEPVAFQVATGATAQFAISFSDVPVGSESTCPTVADLWVTPPALVAGSYVTVTAGGSFAPCGTPPQLFVSPFYS